MPVNPIKRRDLYILLLILVIAAILRFGEPGITEFFHDEAMLSMLAQDMAVGKSFPLEGILASVGIPNPPTSVYVMWLPYMLSSDPLFATMFIAALNVGGVGLLWWIAHRYFGRTIALVAGLTYALNPWAVLYSRKIWAQDFHTPFVLAALLLGTYGFWEGKRWAQVLCLPLLLFALQIHFAAWALLPLYFLLLWQGRKNVSWRAIALSIGLSALVLLPYVIGLSQTLQQDPERLADVLRRSGASQGLSLSSDATVHTWRLASGLGLETWVTPQQQADLLAKVPIPSLLWVLIGGAAMIGAGISIYSVRDINPYTLVIFWAALPLIIFTPTWTDIYPHYFIGSIPALALLTGIGLAWVLERLPRKSAGRTILLGGFAMIVLTQGLWWRGLLRYLDTTSTPFGFTTPLHYLLVVRGQLAKFDDVLIVSDGMDWRFDKEAARWPVLLRDTGRCVRTIKGDGYAVFPSGPFAVAIAPNAPPNPVNNLYLTDSPLTYPDRPGDGGYQIHSFEQASNWTEPPMQFIELTQFDMGIRLIGYHVAQNRMYLEWQLPDANTELDYQYFGHFLDANGERLGQQDAVFWQGRHWCAGDRLITWTDISLPQDVVTLRVGLYRLGTGRDEGQYFSANVLDSAGNPAGQWVDIPLITN
jgi:hypothetical protein